MKLRVKCTSKGCKAYNKPISYEYEAYQDLGYVSVKGANYHVTCVCELCENLTESADKPEPQFMLGEGVSVNIVKPVKDRGSKYYSDGKNYDKMDKVKFNGGTQKATKEDYDMMNKNMKKFDKPKIEE
jgi:hypothetical protein